jgi:hypothetical protein
MKNLRAILWVVFSSGLMGASFSLAMICDLCHMAFFQIKMTFIFINLFFTEHTVWFKTLWRVSTGKMVNDKEQVTSLADTRDYRSSTILLTRATSP